MTQRQAARFACRAITLYLIFWVVSDLTNLPREVLSVLHEWSMLNQTVPYPSQYYLRSAMLFLLANILRMTLWCGFALWFYQVPPSMQRFFGVAESMESPEAQPTPLPEADTAV